jgi:hypothetical protein
MLLTFAISGLLAGCDANADAQSDSSLPGCDSDAGSTGRDGSNAQDIGASDASSVDAPGDSPSADGGPVIISSRRDPALTFRSFLADCSRRGGFVQTHATCAGNNSCRGVSYNRFDRVLIEHTCRAMNSCGGMSCVETAADQNRTAAELYSSDCAGCHGEDQFALFREPGVTEAEGTAKFNRPTRRAQQGAIIAFGIQGNGGSESVSANMPGRWNRYSRAEILRLVDYIHTLPLQTREIVILGLTHEVNPDGGDPVPLDASIPPG